MSSITVVADVTGAQYPAAPAGITKALYVTGSAGVPATASQLAANPGCVRIAQSPVLSIDEASLADVLDQESGAATLADCAPWAKAAIAAFKAVKRPGQREPLIYMSASGVSDVVNALVKGGVTSGVGLWVANWDLTQVDAISAVVSAAGPFPIHAVQYHNAGGYDLSVFSTAWLTTRASVAKPKPAVPPGQWLNGAAWTWDGPVVMTGLGTDSKMHMWVYNPATLAWQRSV
jgi:hypothetical protein